MPIDTTPSTVATNALQAIPFASLIGGPLDACITAQAVAAKTSYEFINEVGLTIDPITGEKKAINVTFQYNNNGQLATLVVPLIILLPIPYLAITTVDIDFLANISAASSSTTETESDTTLGVDVTAEASLGIGPFSLKVNAKANYSSKQHSKATADSRYSVEYTMGVKVSGGQADMPAGLAAVLNILQGSITSVNPNDLMKLTPPNVDFDQVPSTTLQVAVKTPQGLAAPGVTVSLEVKAPGGQNPFKTIDLAVGATEETIRNNIAGGGRQTVVERGYHRYYLRGRNPRQLEVYHNKRLLASTHGGTRLPAAGNSTTVTGVTDKNGNVTFRLTLTDGVYYGPDDLSGKLVISADIPSAAPNNQTLVVKDVTEIAYSIIPLGPTGTELTTTVTKVDFAATTPQTVELVAKTGNDVPLANTIIKVEVEVVSGPGTFDNIEVTAGTAVPPATPLAAQGKTDANGKISFKFTPKSDGAAEGTINFTCDGADKLSIPFAKT